jgi:hypothetical protein
MQQAKIKAFFAPNPLAGNQLHILALLFSRRLCYHAFPG